MTEEKPLAKNKTKQKLLMVFTLDAEGCITVPKVL